MLKSYFLCLALLKFLKLHIFKEEKSKWGFFKAWEFLENHCKKKNRKFFLFWRKESDFFPKNFLINFLNFFFLEFKELKSLEVHCGSFRCKKNRIFSSIIFCFTEKQKRKIFFFFFCFWHWFFQKWDLLGWLFWGV